MEKRWAARRPVHVSVDLQYKDVEVVDCQTRDISLNGAFVEVKQLQPTVNANIDLVFRLGDPGHYTKYKVPGKVARLTGDGIGVTFGETNISSFRSLRQLLNA